MNAVKPIALVLGAAWVSFAAFGETLDHWEFGSEVNGVWTKGAVDARGYGELRDVASPLDSSLGESAPEGADCFGVWRAGLRKAYLVSWPEAPWKLRGMTINFR